MQISDQDRLDWPEEADPDAVTQWNTRAFI